MADGEAWTGAEAEQGRLPTRGDWALLRRFWTYLRPRRRRVFAGLGIVPLMTLAGLAQPYVLKVGIDDYVLAGDTAGLWAISGALLALVVVRYLLGASQSYLLNLAGVEALGDLRRAIFRHVMAQGAAFFDRRPSGSLLTRSTTDVEALGETLTMGMINIFSDVLTIVGIIAAMLLLDARLTLLTFAVSPLLVVVVNVFRAKLRHYSLMVRRSLSRVNGFFAESLTGIKVVQLFGREDKSALEFKRLNFSYLDAYRRSNWYDASLYAIMDGIASICVAVMLWVGGSAFVEEGSTVTLGLLVAFIEYITSIFVPIREFSGKLATLQRAAAALERIFGLLDERHAIGPGRPELAEAALEGSIDVDRVSFAYREDAGDVLHEVSLRLEPGRVVALVGSTGSGKTTIGKLLTRTYDGYRGSIRIDGVELRDIPPERVRRLIGVVQQDVFIFRGTVLDNITLGNRAIGREQAVAAAKLVNAHEFISALPQGYDTPLAERGANLSAGQAQLLSFARAMAHDPPVLVLDEATASIDSMMEVLIQQAIERILALKTVLIVAHRLSTIQEADEIVVLERGRVVESGPHDALMARGGRYATMYRKGMRAALV